jgi:hypothetical protein
MSLRVKRRSYTVKKRGEAVRAKERRRAINYEDCFLKRSIERKEDGQLAEHESERRIGRRT